MLDDVTSSENQQLLIEFPNHIQVTIKREDLLHAQISGNKFRKLKYNLIKARQFNQRTLLTFGGAYSNHIAAVAAAAHKFDFNSIGIIRGEELARNGRIYAACDSSATGSASGARAALCAAVFKAVAQV